MGFRVTDTEHPLSKFLKRTTTQTRISEPSPELTFGLEMELAFAVRKKLYDEWIKTAVKSVDYLVEPKPSQHQNDRLEDEANEAAMRRQERVERGSNGSVGSTDSTKTTSTNSVDDDGRLRVMGYMRAYLNHETIDAPKEPSLIGKIIAAAPKEASSQVWHLTKDDSVLPQREHLREKLAISLDEAKKEYRVVGAELVSSVQGFDDVDNWMPKLEQLTKDLKFDDNDDRGAWFTDLTHLHVHFGIKGEEISLQVAQNVCVLYGLFEREIQSWLPVAQRNSSWCMPIRRGIEREMLRWNNDQTDIEMVPGRRFTADGFASSVYDTTSLEGLKTAISGWSAGEWILPYDEKPSRRIERHAYPLKAREWVSVNLSMARKNKPFTIEFRHHHGTMDPETIFWWVRFLGSLVKFAHYITKEGIQLRGGGSGGIDIMDEIHNISITDLIGLPKAGSAYFRDMKRNNYDQKHETEMDKEDDMIRLRTRLVKRGETTGRFMDDQIMGITTLPQMRGDEAMRPVILTGQGIADRILKIVLEYQFKALVGDNEIKRINLAIHSLGGVKDRQTGDVISLPDGIDFQQSRAGLVNLCQYILEDRTGIGHVYLTALIRLCMEDYLAKTKAGEDVTGYPDWKRDMAFQGFEQVDWEKKEDEKNVAAAASSPF